MKKRLLCVVLLMSLALSSCASLLEATGVAESNENVQLNTVEASASTSLGASGSSSSGSSGAIRWEYYVFNTQGWIATIGQYPNREEIGVIDYLNKLGQEGWMLVTVTDSNIGLQPRSFAYFLKRPL